ncbi:hypothetical protein IF2G_03411 [Cordyceps javanica]|nr:hypothetical protein IF2G_03411 [Cordyceps javanica]
MPPPHLQFGQHVTCTGDDTKSSWTPMREGLYEFNKTRCISCGVHLLRARPSSFGVLSEYPGICANGRRRTSCTREDVGRWTLDGAQMPRCSSIGGLARPTTP